MIKQISFDRIKSLQENIPAINRVLTNSKVSIFIYCNMILYTLFGVMAILRYFQIV